jgi:hypothetical protein
MIGEQFFESILIELVENGLEEVQDYGERAKMEDDYSSIYQ